jgi:hypothetical protein
LLARFFLQVVKKTNGRMFFLTSHPHQERKKEKYVSVGVSTVDNLSLGKDETKIHDIFNLLAFLQVVKKNNGLKCFLTLG